MPDNDLTTSNAAPSTGILGQLAINTSAFPTSAADIRRNLAQLMQRNVLAYPREVPKYYTHLKITEYKRTNLQHVNATTHVGSLILPMPMQMIDSLNVTYDERALGTVLGNSLDSRSAENIFRQLNQRAAAWNSQGGRMAQLAQGTQAAYQALIAGIEGLQTPSAGTLGAIALEQSGRIGSGVATMLGIAPNQFLTIVLEGPKYKMFEFQWRLSPNTPQEAEDLRQVIKIFKNYMSPGIRADGALWSFPHLWHVGFQPNSKYLYKFKPAVLMSFSANYSPQGHVTFHREDPLTDNLGTPAVVDIACRFLELEFWLFNNFNDTNDPWDVSPNRPIDPQDQTTGP